MSFEYKQSEFYKTSIKIDRISRFASRTKALTPYEKLYIFVFENFADFDMYRLLYGTKNNKLAIASSLFKDLKMSVSDIYVSQEIDEQLYKIIKKWIKKYYRCAGAKMQRKYASNERFMYGPSVFHPQPDWADKNSIYIRKPNENT